jgi:HlyD family secretion protein
MGLSWKSESDKSSNLYRTAPVTRGDLLVSISATGTVEPEELVDVGAQVAGKIVAFGTDVSGGIVDYGSAVEKGTVLAQIDDTLYAADVALVEAQLGQAKAGLERSQADMVQLQARLVQAERDWNRARKLGPSEALSQSAYDAAQSAYEVAKANVSVGKAAIVQAGKAVSQSEASLRRARQNLEYCTIKSPVKGVIIDRRVNIGQTVVSSLNAPSLFLIAKDLRRLEVWVAVNEADIGSIHLDQDVRFTVDAFAGQDFQGKVGKIRLNATMTQNVVTYTVEVSTDNSDGRLLPYLTANVKFVVGDRRGVLTVPNTALRWSPNSEANAPDGRNAGQGAGQSGNAPNTGRAQQNKDNPGTLWVMQDGAVHPISVRVGLNDGIRTEVEGDELQDGMEVVTGEQAQADSGDSQTVNPFTPKFFGRGSRR